MPIPALSIVYVQGSHSIDPARVSYGEMLVTEPRSTFIAAELVNIDYATVLDVSK